MTRLIRSLLLTGLCVVFTATTVATVSGADTAAKPTATKAGAKGKAKARGRLPANYARIGLTADQREKIYDVQIKYNAQIADLEKQLVELRGKRDAEVEAVLNSDQKTKLAQIQAEAKSKSKRKPATTTPVKPAVEPKKAAPATTKS